MVEYIKREHYINCVEVYYKQNFVSLSLLYEYYKSKGGTLEDFKIFKDLISRIPKFIEHAMETVMVELNVIFNVMIITKDQKFIKVL